MENLVEQKLFDDIYRGKKVLITGHTGFKGSWLALWLTQLGAEVCGYSLEAPYNPSHLSLLNLNLKSILGDIRNYDKISKTFNDFQPDIVFHLAAQPLVRQSYKEPTETYTTNVIGSLNVYEASKNCKSLKAIISITTDKVYENNEWVWGYRETDRLGGKDPYSSSKAAMEIMTSSYRFSYFNTPNSKLLAVARAGNVIGGGDWADDRLIPDIIRASLKKEAVKIRSPHSVRPWQHVLEPLSGYLLLGQQVLQGKKEFAGAFNFGPLLADELTVEMVISFLKKQWEIINFKIEEPKEKLHEAKLLKLDCSKAMNELSWKPTWSINEGLKRTILWYKEYYENGKINSLTDLNNYISKAKENGYSWVN